MNKETITEGPSVEEALDSALAELGVQQDAVDYEVLEEGGKRLFGIGNEKTARVRVWLKTAFVEELERRETESVETPDTKTDEKITSSERPARDGAPEVDLTDDELDEVADEAVSAVQSILQGFGITASIEEYEGDEGEIILDVVGDDLGVLIGRHGRTLDSLQVLVSAISHRRLGFRYPVQVDVEGYRNRRRVKLEDIAHKAADRAVRNGAPVKLRPMSNFERKVIHVCLRDDVRVLTESEGDEPFRQVVVNPK